MTFLHKSYGKWSKVEKPVMVPMSYKGLHEKDVVKTVPTNSSRKNNYLYVVGIPKKIMKPKKTFLTKLATKLK